MKTLSGASATLGAVLLLASPIGLAQGPKSIEGLESLFSGGSVLQDRNGDGFVDFVNASIVVSESASSGDLAAAAEVAARLGFETSAMNLPLLSKEESAATTEVRVGSGLSGDELKPGEGVIRFDTAGGRNTVLIAGGDDAGTRASAEVFAARLPHIWDPSGPTLQTLIDALRARLAERAVGVDGLRVSELRVKAGEKAIPLIHVEAEVRASADLDKARAALRDLPRGPGPGVASEATSPFIGVRTVRVLLSTRGAKPVSIDLPREASPSARKAMGLRPRGSAKESLDLGSLYTPQGLLLDADEDLIADGVDALLVPAIDGAGVVDLAARLGLESTGITVPLARNVGDITEPEREPTLVLIGRDHQLVEQLVQRRRLRMPSLRSGEGWIEVVPRAFEDRSAVVILGADSAGTARALEQTAERFPHLWARGKDRTTIDDVESELWSFLTARSPAGQAATALYKLERMAHDLAGTELESARVQVSVEKADPGLEGFLRRKAAEWIHADVLEIEVENRDVEKAPVIVQEDLELASEVDEFWTLFRTRLVPRLRKNRPIVVLARLSEPPEIRSQIAEQALAELLRAGAAPGSSVTVLSAYKQGFSWLYDFVRPKLAGKPIERLTIRFAELGPPPEWPYQVMYAPTRWLFELYPIDEVLARELPLDRARIVFERMPIGSPTYEVIAAGAGGEEIFRQAFTPQFVLRPFFDLFPTYEKVRVTTGWLHATMDGESLLDERIVTDPERFWDHFQSKTLPTVYDYVMNLHQGKPRPDDVPHFGELRIDLALSEPDYPLGVDKEHIAPMESLHEEIFFATHHFFDLLGRFTRGTFRTSTFGSLQYAGRVIPIMRPQSDGKPGRLQVTFTGFRSPRPSVVIDYRMRDGSEGRKRLDVPRVRMERPAALGALVREGREGVERLDLRVKVDMEIDQRDELIARTRGGERLIDQEAMSAEQVTALLGHLQQLREAGLYRAALAFHQLGELKVAAGWEHEVRAESEKVATLLPNGSPLPFPDIRALLPSSERDPGEPLVHWDAPLSPIEAHEILARMSEFPEATVYKAGKSYLGKDIWAMDLMSPIEASHWSQGKATALKPTLIYSAREHGNEVSSTSHVLKLAELLLTAPEFRKKLERVNVVIHPITNADGAQLAHDLYRLTPNHMLHAGRPGALGTEVSASQWEDDTRVYPESKIRPDLWRTWRPDIFLNPHGMPDHEWVQLFSEYVGWVGNRVTEPRSHHWLMRGWYLAGFDYLDDPKYPRHKKAAFEIQKYMTAYINAIPEVRALNQRAYDRYRRWGFAFDPDSFKIGFVDDVLLYPAFKGGKADPRSNDFMERNPKVTIWTGVAEAPDETASGDWMKLVATAGLQWDKAILEYLVNGNHLVERRTEEFQDGVRWTQGRTRPPELEPEEN
jgi:hypothetical protein